MKRSHTTTSFLLRTQRSLVCVEPVAAVVPWTDCWDWHAYAKSPIFRIRATWTHTQYNIQYSELCGKKMRTVLHGNNVIEMGLSLEKSNLLLFKCSFLLVCICNLNMVILHHLGGVSHFDLRVQTCYRCSCKLCGLLGHDVASTLYLPASYTLL